jgi:hypothetical protein
VDAVSYNQLDSGNPRIGQNQVQLSGTLAGSRFEREPFYTRKQFGVSFLAWFLESTMQRLAVMRGKPILLGTIGAEFFEQRLLLLDFVAQRAAILRKDEKLPVDLEKRFDFAPIEYRDRKMFVTLTLNGVAYRDLFFDTGSSSAAVVTTRRRWLEWTGRQPDDPRNSTMVAKAWDKYGKWVGAPVKGDLCVAGACASAPLGLFESTGLESSDFDRYPFQTSGLIGNVLFDGRFTVVVDLPHRRFGLFAGSLSALTDPARSPSK